MPSDILIYETGNGGDFLPTANGFATVNGYENAPYLAMFGGDSSWWGNYIALNPYMSQTETALRSVAMNSAGRIAIQNAVKADLSFLDNIDGTTYSFDVVFAGPSRIDISVTINGKVFGYSWNPNTMFLTYKV